MKENLKFEFPNTEQAVVNLRLTKEYKNLSPSPNPSRQGRGSRIEVPIKVGEVSLKFPLPLWERVRVRGILR
jgi:hypothetical protein